MHTKLLLGYCLVALAIGITTLILLYWSYGFNVNRRGDVILDGSLIVSSQPNGAAIYLNNQRYKSNTDTRVTVPEGPYTLRVSETGYRPWERPVVVQGSKIQYYNYLLLFPEVLHTTSVADLAADPSVATQSPDKRWLILGLPEASGSFTLYDLKDPVKPVASTVVLPAASFTPGSGRQSWTAIEWANDNRHVLFQHTYYTANGTPSREYILLDRNTPADSVNLTTTLKLSQTETLNLFNARIDQFYVYDAKDQTLQHIISGNPVAVSVLQHVLAFKTYADDKVLYITDQSPTGKMTSGLVSAVLQVGQQTTTLRSLPPAGAGSYMLNLTQYAGDWYVAIASSGDTTAYIYKNPQDQPTAASDTYPAPWRRVSVSGISFLSFSSSTQFLLAESGQQFVVYDFENMAQYRYTALQPLDQPQTHAVWMDGDRLAYVSDGKLEVFDYDYRNQQSLVAANSAFLPFFSNDFSYLYTLRSPDATNPKPALTSTSLVVK